MKKARKTVVALLIAFLMVAVVFSGCKTEEEAEPEETAVATEEETTEEETTEEVEAEEGTTIEKITLGTRNFYTDPELADMMEEQFYEDTGVELEIRHIPEEDSDDKIASMFMAGDYQDIMHMGDTYYPYVLQELLVDLSPLIDNNETVSAIVEENSTITEWATVGDSIYGISTSNINLFNLWIRDDWRQQMGIDMPESMDDLVELLRAYKVGDLDGDGTKDIDVIPLTSKNCVYYWDSFAAYFGTRTRIYMEDGVAVDPVVTDEYKEFMDFMKSLYDEELLYQNAPTEGSYGAVRSQFYASEAASILIWADSYDSLTQGLADNGYAEDEDLYSMVTPVLSFTDENGTFGYAVNSATGLKCMTTNVAAEDQQEVFDIFFNWYLASDNGIISSSRGVQDYSFEVVDGVMEVLLDVGYQGQSFPPVNLSYEYPFEFDTITQYEYDYIKILFEDYYANDEIQTTLVSGHNEAYQAIVDDWETAAYGCFWKYVLGQYTYDEYLEEYNKLAEDMDLDAVLAGITE